MQYEINTDIPAQVFRAYDIRGVVDKQINVNAVYTLGLALGSEILDCGEKNVAIARDGRLSGEDWINALQAGILATGCDVINIGAVPTPVLYFATHFLETTSGIMITGSHNPGEYNGFKIVIAGEVVFGDRISALRDRILLASFHQGEGHLETHDIRDAYIDHIAADIKLARPLKVVIDAGNGIAGDIAPRLFERLGAKLIKLHCEVDGTFPNHHPDPSQPENLEDVIIAVKNEHADIGLAFDGDGDRLGVITNMGDNIWPDRQLMLFAQSILSTEPGATIVYDVKCSRYLEPLIQEKGGVAVMWKTGHSFIKQKMKELGAALGGEMSGHLFFRDRYFGYDDALYAGARLLEILSHHHESSSDIFSRLPNSVNTPELKLSLDDEAKFQFIEDLINIATFPDAKINNVDGLRVDFDYGWGLVRASNTTPCVVFRFEADSAQNLLDVQNVFRQQLLRINPELVLPF